MFAEGIDTLVIYRVKAGASTSLVEWMRAKPHIPLVLYCSKVFGSWVVGRCVLLGENKCSVGVRSCARQNSWVLYSREIRARMAVSAPATFYVSD